MISSAATGQKRSIVRTCDLVRARAAAASCLRGVERFRADAPTAPEDVAQAAQSNAQLGIFVGLALLKLSHTAAQKFGAQWVMSEAEAEAISGPAVEVIELELGKLPEGPWARLCMALGLFAVPRVLGSMMGAGQAPLPAAEKLNAPKHGELFDKQRAENERDERESIGEDDDDVDTADILRSAAA